MFSSALPRETLRVSGKHNSPGTVQQVFELGGGGEGSRRMHEGNFLGGGGWRACGFLFNFSKVTENAIMTIKLLIFFHIFSDVAIGSENSPSLN